MRCGERNETELIVLTEVSLALPLLLSIDTDKTISLHIQRVLCECAIRDILKKNVSREKIYGYCYFR